MNSTKTRLAALEPALLHGWDAQTQSWHGPVPLDRNGTGARLALAKMKNARGAFHFGRFRCSAPGVPSIDFYTAIYDRNHVGLAIVHLDGLRGGPIAVAAVLPARRRKLLGSDFPLELMTLVSLLSAPVNKGAELAIHDYIEESLRAQPSATHVFALETAELHADAILVLSMHIERLSAAMLDWLDGRTESLIEDLSDDADCGLPAA